MSDTAARAALSRMHMREVAIAPTHATLIADLQQLSATDPKLGQEMFLASRAELCAAYGMPSASQSKPFAFANGIAVIPVHGSLINRFSGSYGSVTGYNFIRSQAQAADADPDVEAIVFDLNSGGGEAAGCFELSAELAGLSKPTLGVIDSNCYSACYAIGSALDQLVVTPSGGVGSIGVVMMHVNMEKMLKNFGVEVSFIYSGEHKVDGNPFMALPDEVRAELQAGADASRERFAQLVADNRGLELKTVLDTEARTYRADAALAAGLIDAIATPQQAVQAFLGELSGSKLQPKRKDQAMSAEATKPGSENQAQAAHDARVAERARISGIQSCEEAKGRETLASHLALNTDLSVDAAKAILAASPAAAAAAAPAPAAAAPKSDPLAAAMASAKHPNVGADSAAALQGGEGLSLSQQILRDQAAATGVKLG